MATHSSILAWRIPWTVGYSPWPCEESDTIEAAQHACMHLTNCCSLGGDGGRHFGDFTLANSSQSLWKMLFLFLSSNH